MLRKIAAIGLFAFCMIFQAAPDAPAITYGVSDGTLHPNVGVLAYDSNGDKIGICSGTLISSTVFLTAAHCAYGLPSSTVYVSFDSTFSQGGTFYQGVITADPLFGHDSADPHDIAVVVFPSESPVTGITPALLPAAGLLNEGGPRGLRGRQFTAVGYGDLAPEISGGPPFFGGFGLRRYAASTFNALNKSWLRLSGNDATGNGGTCYGDSGGPNFVGAGYYETNVIAAITITGDAMCLATNVGYRLDTRSARNFLAEYVDLP